MRDEDGGGDTLFGVSNDIVLLPGEDRGYEAIGADDAEERADVSV